jgi:hypothetical protein
MLIIGGLLIPAFVFVEWKVAKLPMMPSKLKSQTKVVKKEANGVPKSVFSKATCQPT